MMNAYVHGYMFAIESVWFDHNNNNRMNPVGKREWTEWFKMASNVHKNKNMLFGNAEGIEKERWIKLMCFRDWNA